MEKPKKEINMIFEKLNVYKHQNLFIISDILALFCQKKISEIPIYFDALKSSIEELTCLDKTIIVPSFTYQFCDTKLYDLKTTKPQSGALANSFLKSPKFKRTLSPLTSHLIGGRFVPKEFFEPSTTTFGNDSLYKWMSDNDTLILNLGLPISSMNGWIISHHIEEIMGVGYRHYKKFKGKIYNDGKYIGRCCQQHYVRSDTTIQNDFSQMNNWLLERGLIVQCELNNVLAWSVRASYVCDAARDIIKRNPNGLLAKN